MFVDIIHLLHLAKSKGASDLHLVVSRPPIFRIDGSLVSVGDSPPLTPDDIDQAFTKLSSEKQKEEFDNRLEVDFGYTIPDVGRLRCNVAKQRGTNSLAIRLLPLVIPTIDELNLPAVCKELILRPRGLVVVTGPTGSGKSTTLAAMINHLNSNERRHVVTIEDPIEYVYSDMKCTIIQREIGSDTFSFAEALKHVLRHDPDVILVGEMRDLETAAAVLTIAETGHLVLTTGHAPSASQAIDRVVDLFPPHERHLAQSRLAFLLIGVLCQTLIPRADTSGRIPAVEIMLAASPVRNLIREGKTYQLPNIIRMHTREGMQLLDQALINLYLDRRINQENLLAFCNDRGEVLKFVGESKRSNLGLAAVVNDYLEEQ
jgi:twitching motility protein PilT